MIRKKKNEGFTLVEVIVSMLVLSITIVSVLSAFSTAAKSNTRAKKMQGAESLLENLLEYTKANAKGFDSEKDLDALGLYTDLFLMDSCTVTTKFSDTNDVEVSELAGVKEGLYGYTVRITRDRKPDAYNTESLNDHKVISFGETGSKTVVINASVPDYDKDALDLFLAMNKEKVEQHNLAVEAEKLVNPTPTMTPMTELTQTEMEQKLKRELWLETSQPKPDKVQLRAYMVYTVPDDLPLPDGAERQIKTEFFASGEFDRSGGVSEASDRLRQIYVLYTPSSVAKGLAESDIRILDKEGQLDANLFLAYQMSGLEAVDAAVSKDLGGRYTSSERIRVSFQDSTVLYEPLRLGLYCSSALSIVGAEPSTVKKEVNSLVAGSEECRVVTVNIEVIDPATGKVLTGTKEPVACLQ